MRYLSESEIQTVYNALPHLSVRDQLVVRLALDYGLRRCEIVDLDISDMQQGDYFTVKTRKRGKNRSFKKDPKLRSLINKRILKGAHTTKLVHCGERGIGLVMKRLRDATSLPQIHTHMLRHTFAMRLVDNMRVAALQDVLGHRTLHATGVYIHSTQEEIDAAISKLTSSAP